MANWTNDMPEMVVDNFRPTMRSPKKYRTWHLQSKCMYVETTLFFWGEGQGDISESAILTYRSKPLEV